jgi:hypothetical protein
LHQDVTTCQQELEELQEEEQLERERYEEYCRHSNLPHAVDPAHDAFLTTVRELQEKIGDKVNYKRWEWL